jgi:hypothetical protein
MKHLILLNDPPYGAERSFNGLRMAHALAKNNPNVCSPGSTMPSRVGPERSPA